MLRGYRPFLVEISKSAEIFNTIDVIHITCQFDHVRNP